MRQLADEGAAADSLTASNPLLGGAGRSSKRLRVEAATAGEEQEAPGMHLRSAQKRLLAADAGGRTDSAVDSSQQLDRTDSCGGPRGGSADAPVTAAAGGKKAQQSRQQQQPRAALEEPPPKRRRVARAGVPVPVPSSELRRYDRPSPPIRRVAAALLAPGGSSHPASRISTWLHWCSPVPPLSSQADVAPCCDDKPSS
jgi:hypothetical protein